MGVGEIMLTSVDQDGSRRGYDMDLIAAITEFADVPVTVYGGASGSDSMKEAIQIGKVDGVCAATILHYDDTTIGDLKEDLAKADIPVRIVPSSAT
jgi:cyclase